MASNLSEAKRRFEAEGLYVTSPDADSLQIAYSHEDVGGIKVLSDASLITRNDGSWTVVFPGKGMQVCEVSGRLKDLVELVWLVYHRFRSQGGSFSDVCSSVLGEHKVSTAKDVPVSA